VTQKGDRQELGAKGGEGFTHQLVKRNFLAEVKKGKYQHCLWRVWGWRPPKNPVGYENDVRPEDRGAVDKIIEKPSDARKRKRGRTRENS